MKFKQLLLFLLTFTLFFSTQSIYADTLSTETELTTENNIEEETKDEFDNSLYINYVNKGTENEISKFKSTIINLPNNKYFYMIPITITQKGIVDFTFQTNNIKKDISIYLCEDTEADNIVSGTTITKGNNSITLSCKFTTDKSLKTYYILLSAESIFSDSSITCTAIQYLTTDENILKKNISKVNYSPKKSHKTYYQVTLKYDGVITVKSNKDLTISLYDNSKLNKITKDIKLTNDNSNTTSYMLSSGTYYICVKNIKDIFTIKYYFEKINTNYSISKSDAKTISSSITDIFSLNEDINTSHWYKFTYYSSKKFSITCSVFNANTDLNISIIDSSGEVLETGIYKISDDTSVTFKSTQPLSSGTYYIKLNKAKASTYAQYKISIN